jgi:hypothetical protein
MFKKRKRVATYIHQHYPSPHFVDRNSTTLKQTQPYSINTDETCSAADAGGRRRIEEAASGVNEGRNGQTSESSPGWRSAGNGESE